MVRPPHSEPTIDEQIAALRPLLTQALHAVLPDLPLIDCGRMANQVLDDAANGKMDLVKAAQAFLEGVVARSERARLGIQ